MKQKIIISLLLFLFLVVNTDVYAQKKVSSNTGIGKIDMYVVLLLHPEMIKYNTEKQAFSINRNEADKKRAEKEKFNNSEQVSKLDEQMQELKEKMMAEEKKYMEKVEERRNKYTEEIIGLATAPAAVKEVTYRQMVLDAEAVHYSIMNSYSSEYAILEEKKSNLTKYEFNEEYTTPEETLKRFDKIVNETNEYIKKVASKKGINVVLNSGYKRLMRKSFNLPNDNRLIPVSRSLGEFFKPSFPQELAKDELGIKGFYEGLNSKTKRWLDEAGPILNRMRSNLMNSDIILGGTDLTEDVLSALYKDYKLDPNISKAVIQSALSY